MKQLFYILFSCLMITPIAARNAGIVVACSDRYAKDLYASLMILRRVHSCQLPIEIWYSGDELSETTKRALQKVGNVSFHDIAKFFHGDPEKYRGYQIKGYALYASAFEELILMDADVVFYQDPQVLLDHPAMKSHAAYFFRDREDFVFTSYNEDFMVYEDRYFTAKFTYEQRRKMFLHLIPTLKDFIPDDWSHYWKYTCSEFQNPTPSEHQDAGCIAINKNKSPKGCYLIWLFNEMHTTFYQYILGDKETYWMALAASNESFYVNPTHPYRIFRKEQTREMFHFLDDAPFFQQKSPIETGAKIRLSPTGKLAKKRKLTQKEARLMDQVADLFYLFEEDYIQETH